MYLFKPVPSRQILGLIGLIHILAIIFWWQYWLVLCVIGVSLVVNILRWGLLKNKKSITAIRLQDNTWQIKVAQTWYRVDVLNSIQFGFLFISFNKQKNKYATLVANDSLDEKSWRELIIALKI